jgi:hypothetical protein
MELDIAKMINQHAQKKKWEKEERWKLLLHQLYLIYSINFIWK